MHKSLHTVAMRSVEARPLTPHTDAGIAGCAAIVHVSSLPIALLMRANPSRAGYLYWTYPITSSTLMSEPTLMAISLCTSVRNSSYVVALQSLKSQM
jgi:hypothetical protein